MAITALLAVAIIAAFGLTRLPAAAGPGWLWTVLLVVLLAALFSLVYICYRLHRGFRRADESETYYKMLVDIYPDGVLILGNRRIVWTNTHAADILGCTSGDALLGRMMDEFFPQATRERVETIMYPMVLRDTRFSDKLEILTAKKEFVVCALNMILLKDLPDIEPPAVMLILRDVTREEALKNEVMQYVRMEALSRMAAGIAHNFNNLLGGILGYGSLIAELHSDDESKKYSQAIMDACRQGNALADELLAFALGTKQPHVPTAVSDLLEEVELSIQARMPNDIVARFHCAEDLPKINAASDDIVRAVVNIIDNALEAMPDGGLLVIEAEKTAVTPEHSARLLHLSPGDYIRLSVSDTGVGIPIEHLDRVFEPFFSTKGRKHGAGLGLSMVYAIVREHDGVVRVYSEPGKGTVVHLYLPIFEHAHVDRQPPVEKPPHAIRLAGLKVLLLEDNVSMVGFIEELLTKRGSIVETVGSLTAAYEAVNDRGYLPDIVIVDLVLPDGSGTAFIENLKTKAPNVGILAISGYSPRGQASRMLEAGAHRFLQKPFTGPQLLNMMAVVLHAGTSGTEDAPAGRTPPPA